MSESLSQHDIESNNEKVVEPNYTQMPNLFFDYWMAKLSHVEFKVLSSVSRYTFGWQKKQDDISISQIVKMTGAARQSVINALQSLQERKLIIKKLNTSETYGNEANTYSIKVFIPRESTTNDGASTMAVPPPSPMNVLAPSPMAVPTKEPKLQKKELLTTLEIDLPKKSVVVVPPVCLALGADEDSFSRLLEVCTEAQILQACEVAQSQNMVPDNFFGWIKNCIEKGWEPKATASSNAGKHAKWWNENHRCYEGNLIPGVVSCERVSNGIEFSTIGPGGKLDVIEFEDSAFVDRIKAKIGRIRAFPGFVQPKRR